MLLRRFAVLGLAGLITPVARDATNVRTKEGLFLSPDQLRSLSTEELRDKHGILPVRVEGGLDETSAAAMAVNDGYAVLSVPGDYQDSVDAEREAVEAILDELAAGRTPSLAPLKAAYASRAGEVSEEGKAA